MQRRASVASPYISPEHYKHQPIIVDHQHQHHRGSSGHGHHHQGSASGRRLPMTPNEEPYYRHTQDTVSPVRPHSRAESAPDHPLPSPWRPTLAPRNQLIHSPTALSPTALSPSSSPPPQARSPVPLVEHHHHHHKAKKPNFKEPLVSPLSLTKPYKRKGSLNPIRQKSASVGGKHHLSGSIDAQLHLRGLSHHTSPHGTAVVHPAQALSRHQSFGGHSVPVGWGGSNTFHHSPRASGSATIQNFMQKGLPVSVSPYTSVQDDMRALGETGSATSVAIKQELFLMPGSGSDSPSSPQGTSPQGTSPQGSIGPSPHVSKAHFTSGENLKVDPISGGEISHKRHHPYPKHGHHDNRSMSAKPARPHSMYNGLPPEFSTSVGHLGPAADHHNHFNYENESEVGIYIIIIYIYTLHPCADYMHMHVITGQLLDIILWNI